MNRAECAAPELHDLIAERAPRDGVERDPRLRAHLLTCEACRAEAERARRMVDVWSGDRATAGEVEAARARFERRRDAAVPPVRPRIVLAYGALGAGLAALLLIATQRTRQRAPEVAAPIHAIAPPPAPLAPATAPHIEGPDGVRALSQGMRVVLGAGEHAKVVLGPGRPPVALDGPCVVEFHSAPGEVAGWQLAYVEGDPAATPSAPSAAPTPTAPIGTTRVSAVSAPAASSAGRGTVELPATPAPSVERRWRDTAEAMKRNDTAAADHALADLCKAPDHATRDAARLARAELWIQEGKGAAVAPVLADLAAHGATPLVRSRAAELRGRIH